MNFSAALLASEETGVSLNIWPDLATFTHSLILFSILAFVLWKFAWPHILHALEERELHIKEEIDRAEKNRAESERVLKEYQVNLEAARADAQKIIDEGKADALRLREQILKETREESARLTAQATREIKLAEAKALHGLKVRTVELATSAAERILERALKPEDHREVVDRFIQETDRELSRREA